MEATDKELYNIETSDSRSFIPMIMNQDDDVVDDVHATYKDHNEGIYKLTLNPICMNLVIMITFYIFVLL